MSVAIVERYPFEVDFCTRYNAADRAHRESTTFHRNYFVLDTDLPTINFDARRYILTGIVKRLADPSKLAQETKVHILIYRLRLQALAWAFFSGKEFVKVASGDLSNDAGYGETRTETEESIISGYFSAISNFKQGKIFAGRAAFNTADKIFGVLRHVEWFSSLGRTLDLSGTQISISSLNNLLPSFDRTLDLSGTQISISSLDHLFSPVDFSDLQADV